MELWIKTQEGDLIKPNNIKVGSIIYPYICVYTRQENNSVCLGEYKSEERAKEVLKEIENCITQNPKILFRNFGNGDIESFKKHVVDMPFVKIENSEPEIVPLNKDFILFEMPKE